jgi:hypothetical protein
MEPVNWRGSFVTEQVALAVKDDPTLVTDGKTQAWFAWQPIYVTNVDRLDSKAGNVFTRPPDHLYVIKFVQDNDHDYVRVFKPRFEHQSGFYWIAHGVPKDGGGERPVRVVMVHKPSYEQGKLCFRVDGMNGDLIGVYTFPLFSRVARTTITPFIRRDLGLSSHTKVHPFRYTKHISCIRYFYHVYHRRFVACPQVSICKFGEAVQLRGNTLLSPPGKRLNGKQACVANQTIIDMYWPHVIG